MLMRANTLAKQKLEEVKLQMISTLQSDEGKALFNQQVNIAASAKAIAKSDAAGKVLPLNDHELEEVRPASFLFNYCTNFLLHTY